MAIPIGNTLHNFWADHYQVISHEMEKTAVIKAQDAHEMFTNQNPNIEMPISRFMSQSAIIGIKQVKRKIWRQLGRLLYATPKSEAAINHHTTTYDITNLSNKRTASTEIFTENKRNRVETRSEQTTFSLVNIRGLITNKNNKCAFIRDHCTKFSNSNIIAITESWLTSGHQDAEILDTFENFQLTRADRNTESKVNEPDQLKSRGGCLLLTSPDIIHIPILSFTNGNCEMSITELPQLKLLIMVVYNPPPPNFSLVKFKDVLNKIRQHLSSASNIHDLLLCGDFNFPPTVVNWIDSDEGIIAHAMPGQTDQKTAFELLIELTNEYGLQQQVSKPTRKENILDLVFTSDSSNLSDQSVTTIEPVSDHNLVNFVMEYFNNITPTVKMKPSDNIGSFNFARTNKDKLNDAINAIDWESLLKDSIPVSELSKTFINQIYKLAEQAKVPKYKPHTKPSTQDLIIQDLLNLKHKLEMNLTKPTLRQLDRTAINQHIEEINTQLKDHYNEVKYNEERHVAERVQTNPKAFFAFANKYRTNKPKIGPLKSGETYESDAKRMAEIFSNQFQSIFSNPLDCYPEMYPQRLNIPKLDDLQFTRDDIIKSMEKVRPNSAAGHDRFPSFFLHHYAEALSVPIYIIWRRSLDSGEMPEGINKSVITPIHKNGTKSNPLNYRPVALTSQITKIFERVLHKAILNHLMDNNLLNDTQHGFRPGRSTLSQLLHYYDSVLSLLEKRSRFSLLRLFQNVRQSRSPNTAAKTEAP